MKGADTQVGECTSCFTPLSLTLSPAGRGDCSTYDAGAEMPAPLETASGLAAVLRGVVADMQHASGADIVSIFLYEEASRKYYAPFATGQPQESLLDSLADMSQQLDRYLGYKQH